MKSNILNYIKKLKLKPEIRPCLSSKSKQFLYKIQKQIDKSKPNIIKPKEIDSDDIDKIKNYTMYKFMPKEIREYIEMTNPTIQSKYDFYSRDRKVQVFLFGYHQTNTSHYLALIQKWLSVVSLYSRKTCAKELSIYLYLTPLKKQITDIGEPIREINANTAFTTSCSAANSIFIFREEEWFKVFIHETFHCFGLDFSEIDASLSNNQIRSLFPGLNNRVDVRLYETYCEMWAEIINVLFVKKNNTMTRRNTGVSRTIKYRYGNMVEKQLMYEQKFSLFQCKKILVQNKITYVDLFEKKNVYKESTQIFSYFILKSIFMYHLNEFIEWCIEKNKDSLNFIKTKENIREYGNIIENYYLDRDYIQTIHEINIDNSPEYIQKTLRMSLFG